MSLRPTASRRVALHSIASALLGLVLAACPCLDAFADAAAPANDGAASDIADFADASGTRLPRNVTLIDESGQERRFGSFVKRPAILVFAYYTCPQLCGVVLQGLVDGLANVAVSDVGDYDVIVISIDPHDTPALAAQQRAHTLRGARVRADRWQFLVGSGVTVKTLAAAAGFRYVYDPIEQRFVHPAGVVVIDRDGVVRSTLRGTTFAAPTLAATLQGAAASRSIPSIVGVAWNRICGVGGSNGGRDGAVWIALRVVTLAVVAALCLLLWHWRRSTRGAR